MNTIDINKKVAVLSVEHPAEVLAMKAVVLSIALLLCGYVFLVSRTALNVIASREADARAAKLESALGMLQQRYYTLAQAITSDRAAHLGLQPVAETAYVYRPSTVGMAYTPDTAN